MKAQIWNNSKWISETDPDTLKELFGGILQKCGFHVMDYIEHHFQPQGFTALWLLAESHFAVHTFPEFGKSYIELSSCNLDYYKTFIDLTENV